MQLQRCVLSSFERNGAAPVHQHHLDLYLSWDDTAVGCVLHHCVPPLHTDGPLACNVKCNSTYKAGCDTLSQRRARGVLQRHCWCAGA
jgi:hypothetical protein